MKINNINSINNINLHFNGFFKDFIRENILERTPVRDEFLHSKEIEENSFKSFLKEDGKISKEDYYEILQNHPLYLNFAKDMVDEKVKKLALGAILMDEINIPRNKTYSNPQLIAKLAILLDRIYKNEYGDNYEIVSLGTSPAAVANGMKAMGNKVLFLPVSGLSKGSIGDCNILSEDNILESCDKYPNVKILGYYLKQQNVGSDKNKKYILLDYMCSGNTAFSIRDLMVFGLGVPYDNVKIRSLTDDADSKFKIHISDSEKMSLRLDCSNESIEAISNVPHFNVIRDEFNKEEGSIQSSKFDSCDEVAEEFDKYSTKYARAFSLCVLDELHKKKEI